MYRNYFFFVCLFPFSFLFLLLSVPGGALIIYRPGPLVQPFLSEINTVVPTEYC